MSLTLVILAAGAGSRYGGPKQLAPVGPGGEALLEYSAFDALRAGFSSVVLIVHPDDEEAFRRRFAAGMARRVPLAYVRQTTSDLPADFAHGSERVKPWGTAHAVLAVEPEVAGAFAVLNADDFYGAGSFATLADFLSGPAGASPVTLAVIGFPVAQTLSDAGPVSRARCRVDEQDFLRRIDELQEVWRQDGRILYRDAGGAELPLSGDELVSMNMWGLPRGLLAELRRRFAEFLSSSGDPKDAELRLPDVVRDLVRDRRCRVEVHRGSGPWCGITFRQDRERVASVIASLIARGEYPRELWI